MRIRSGPRGSEAFRLSMTTHITKPSARPGGSQSSVSLRTRPRRWLQAELDEHAFLAAQWRVIEQLLGDMGALEEQYSELQERAAGEEIPRSLLPQWQDWREENRRFEEGRSVDAL